jgi:hypothetical protein
VEFELEYFGYGCGVVMLAWLTGVVAGWVLQIVKQLGR